MDLYSRNASKLGTDQVGTLRKNVSHIREFQSTTQNRVARSYRIVGVKRERGSHCSRRWELQTQEAMIV